ncbi:MAG TPA: EAL domain-containing protein [Methylotenera sp.]|nr:EAL domain-containing protein [Methylotenera sp.]
MLGFININNLWLIGIALIVAFVSSITAFRHTTSLWFSSPYQAKVWLIGGLTSTGLGAWFISAICVYTINNPTLTVLITAFSIVCLILVTLLMSMLDLFLRTKKLSAHHSRENLSQMAMIDTLTQLPNRRALVQHLDAAIRRSERTGTSLAIAFIDIDNFKHINDSLGHQTGDEVLQEVAKRLVAAVRGCDEVARIGGDEFIALIEEVKSDEDCITIVDRMVSSIREVTVSNHSDLNVSASIGVAIFPQDGNADQIISSADAAMYRAKKDGKNQFRFFDADIASTSEQLLETQHDLKSALANDELKLHYQIKIDSITREPIGAEALLRWEHPVRGLLTPAEFMPAAERFGLSYAISAWVIEECCRTLHHLNYLHLPFSISINLSYQQLRNVNLVNEVTRMLKRFNLPSSSLLFEITESAATKNQLLFNNMLERFKAADIKVAIDDFGSLPSSLAYLQHLDVSELKLDPAFINNIENNHKTRGIIQAVIKLAHVLDLNVVAEGVENEDQRKILTELGCDQMQGFLISRPVPEERLIRLLKKLSIHFESGGQFSIDDLKKL